MKISFLIAFSFSFAPRRDVESSGSDAGNKNFYYSTQPPHMLPMKQHKSNAVLERFQIGFPSHSADLYNRFKLLPLKRRSF